MTRFPSSSPYFFLNLFYWFSSPVLFGLYLFSISIEIYQLYQLVLHEKSHGKEPETERDGEIDDPDTRRMEAIKNGIQ